MNKKIFNAKLKEIQKMYLEIKELSKAAAALNSEIENKENRNFQQFSRNRDKFAKQVDLINGLYGNKYFDFFVEDSFTTDSNILESEGFYFNERIGAMCAEPSDEVIYNHKSLSYGNDRKTVTFTFDKVQFCNKIEYKFFDEKGLPVYPKKIEYQNQYGTFELSDSFFRFFDRNISTDFKTEFVFHSKEVEKIIFTFDSKISNGSTTCRIGSTRYADSGTFTWNTNIYKNKKILKVFKTCEDSKKPIKYEWSKDNINFNLLEFKNSEAVINNSFSAGDTLYIRFTLIDSSEIEDGVFVEMKDVSDTSSKIIESDISYKLSETVNSDKMKIALNYSSYKKIKEELLFSNIDFNFDDVFYENDNVYYFHNKFLKNISGVSNSDINKLETYDSVEAMNESLNYLSFIYDSRTNKLYASSFMSNFTFRVEYETISKLQTSDISYYTPILFDIAVKG